MAKKKTKDKRLRPKINEQIPISRVRALKPLSLGPKEYLQRAREYPILGCWIMKGWREEGITPIIIARQQSPERVLFANYLVDLYCLGIKDAFANADVSRAAFIRKLPEMCNSELEPCSVELAHEVVYGGLEYASRYGFQPHHDFTALFCDQVLDPPEAHPRIDNVVFGKDGKPFYVAGPYDDEHKVRSVIATLTRTAGEGNFHYLAGLGPLDLPDE